MVIQLGSLAGVRTLQVNLSGSGAIDDLEFCGGPGREGWMTGGGTVQLEGWGRGANAQFITHGFIIRCDGSHARFQYQDHAQGLGESPEPGNFHLKSVTTVVCTDAGLDPEPPATDFDTLTLPGLGRWNGVSGATVIVTLTADGQPGTGDTITIEVNNVGGDIVSHFTSEFLDHGNHQAH